MRQRPERDADLLGGGAPLRGRAKLELVLQPFSYREAASFWQLTDDSELAFRVHALLGGTPAYRAMAFGPPADRESFDHWVVQRLLNPAGALFREGSLLLREESGITDPAPYHGVLAAIAAGFTADTQRTAAARDDIELVDLDRLYQGD